MRKTDGLLIPFIIIIVYSSIQTTGILTEIQSVQQGINGVEQRMDAIEGELKMRINEYPSVDNVANDDFVLIDGNTNGTRKIETSKFKVGQELIAPIELTNIASRSYNIGHQFIYDGELCTAMKNISAGDEIVIGNESVDEFLPKVWNGDAERVEGSSVWIDGENVYLSSLGNNYVLDKSTSTWLPKTWTGGPNTLSSEYIWTDGDRIFYSRGESQQYLLDRDTDTWNSITWPEGFGLFGNSIWTDGINIYYNAEWIYDKSTRTWSSKTWYGDVPPWFDGKYVWTDGENIYYSNKNDNMYRVLNKSTDTWSTVTWNIEFYASSVWTDGENVYMCNGDTSNRYVLNKSTKIWEPKTWPEVSDNFYGSSIWSYNNIIYYSNSSLNRQWYLSRGNAVKSKPIVEQLFDLQQLLTQ